MLFNKTTKEAIEVEAVLASEAEIRDRLRAREAELLSASVAREKADQAYHDAAREADGPEDKKFLQASIDRSRAQSRVEWLTAALDGDKAKLAELQAKRLAIGKEQYLATARKLVTAREAATTKLAKTLAAFVGDVAELYIASQKITVASPVGPLDSGCKVAPKELADLVALEIARLAHQAGCQHAIPGEFRAALLNKQTIKPLATALAEANSYLLSQLDKTPDKAFVRVEPEAAQPDTKPPVETAAPPAPKATHTAHDVMATIQKVKLA